MKLHNYSQTFYLYEVEDIFVTVNALVLYRFRLNYFFHIRSDAGKQ